MAAAGYLEGVDQQHQWLRQQVAANPDDAYWQVQGLLLAQLDGLYEGYNAAMAAADAAGTLPAGEWLSRESIMFLNSNGELYDLLDMFDAEEAQARLARMQPDELLTHLALQGKCSALIKVTADLGDIVFGHSTWDSFTAMTRIYKHYQLQLQQVPGGVAGQGLSFSSYPGELASDDDFYLTSSKLVVLETTNHIYNFTILEPRLSAKLAARARSQPAASNGSAWVDTFRRHNSGTYNNQYMVLDLKRFMPRRQLQEGLLWVAEQLPGVVEAADMTQVLARGYWPSYNVAFFPDIYDKAGYPSLIDHAQGKGPQYGDPARWLMYQVSPRANIFRRDQGNVHALEDLKHLMRYNDYQNDAFSNGQPVASVCARGDLAKKGAIPKGCYDTKVSSYSMALAMESEVVGGPTAQGQPAFQWGSKWDVFAHRGMPDRYDFKFEKQSAADLLLPGVECADGQQQQQQQALKVAGSAGNSAMIDVAVREV
ncbi:laminin A [Scenedesmus sp. NREL 46B-D3]|nr:laminin A [Scenedesmus sp. NREL 46B-D3]